MNTTSPRCRAPPPARAAARRSPRRGRAPTTTSWCSGELAARQRPRSQQAVAVLVRPQRRDEEHERLRHAVRRDAEPVPRRASPGLNRSWSTASGMSRSLLGSTSRCCCDLGPQALGVDDDRVGGLHGARVVASGGTRGPAAEIESGCVNACIVLMCMTSDHDGFTIGAISVLKTSMRRAGAESASTGARSGCAGSAARSTMDR